MTTKERILATSLRLFNEEGTDVVTVRYIAQKLGMSHGNLCYHFANTDAIVTSLYEQLVGLITQQIACLVSDEYTLLSLLQLADKIMATLHQYRFLMLDFVGIMRRNPAIREQHQELIQQRKVVFQQMLAGLRAAGLLQPELYLGYDEHLLTQLVIIGDFGLAHAEWMSGRNTTDTLLYSQQLIRALLAPLLTERGWSVWQQHPVPFPGSQSRCAIN